MKINRTITFKLSALAGLIAAVASLIVGLLVYYGSVDIVVENTLHRLQYETNAKAIRLTSHIGTLGEDVRYLAGTPPVWGIPRARSAHGIDPTDGSSLADWENRLAMIFAELIRAKPQYRQIRYIGVSDEGLELVRVEGHGVLTRRVPSQELQLQGDTEYFSEAIATSPGSVYLSHISLNREHGEVVKPHVPVIRAATAIYVNGVVFGIVIINMDIGAALDRLVLNTPQELIPYVTDEQGYFLAHPDRSMTFGFDLGHEHKIQEVLPAGFDVLRRDLRRKEFTFRDPASVTHVVKAAFDPIHRERFLGVLLSTSQANLLQASKSLRDKSLGIIAILVVVSLVIASSLASALLRPLQLIAKASDDLAHGRAIGPLPVEAKDEIGDLARAFDGMRLQLLQKEQLLIESHARAHRTNKMASLGEMASGMAHEINSPLQVISMVAERLRRAHRTGKIGDMEAALEKITSNARKVSDIVESLRKVSRDSAGDAFAHAKLGDIVADTIGLTRERFELKSVAVSTSYEGVNDQTLIRCQRLQISQVLINLFNNAYDAVLNSEANRWIKLELCQADGLVEISVTDSGPGVPQGLDERIFEPLFTSKDIGTGTGLGLSISKEIAQKHGGTLTLDRGSSNTRFVLRIPALASAPEVASVPAAVPVSAPSASKARSPDPIPVTPPLIESVEEEEVP